MAIVPFDGVDLRQRGHVDVAICIGYVNIDDAHGHAGGPFAIVSRHLLSKAGLAGQDDKSRPG